MPIAITSCALAALCRGLALRMDAMIRIAITAEAFDAIVATCRWAARNVPNLWTERCCKWQEAKRAAFDVKARILKVSPGALARGLCTRYANPVPGLRNAAPVRETSRPDIDQIEVGVGADSFLTDEHAFSIRKCPDMSMHCGSRCNNLAPRHFQKIERKNKPKSIQSVATTRQSRKGGKLLKSS